MLTQWTAAIRFNLTSNWWWELWGSLQVGAKAKVLVDTSLKWPPLYSASKIWARGSVCLLSSLIEPDEISLVELKRACWLHALAIMAAAYRWNYLLHVSLGRCALMAVGLVNLLRLLPFSFSCQEQPHRSPTRPWTQTFLSTVNM